MPPSRLEIFKDELRRICHLRMLLKIRIKENSRDTTQELSQFLKEIMIHSTCFCTKERTPFYSVYGLLNTSLTKH